MKDNLLDNGKGTFLDTGEINPTMTVIGPLLPIAKENPTVHTDIDKVYDMVEGNGRYKYVVVIAASIAFLCHMFYLFAIPLFLIQPVATCNIEGYWHECTRKEVCENDGVLYKFNKPVEFNFVTEFGWYCDDATPSLFTAMSFFLGTTFSVLIASNLSDNFGRIPVLVVGVLGNMFGLALLIAFASPYVCMYSSFIIGFFTMANNSTSFSFLADSVAEKYREILPTVMNIMWAIGEIALALIMWTGIQWRGMCLIIFLFSATFFISLYWLRESPKFYFAQKRMREAQARLRYMAAFNGVDVSRIKLGSSASQEEEEEMTFSQRMKIMCCNFPILRQIILVTLLFTTGNMIFYALSLNLEHMGSNPYLNGTFLAIAEVVACAVGGVAIRYINPKIALSISFLLTAIGVAGLGIFWDNPFWGIAFCILGKLGSASVDNLLYTLSGMFFPTEILGGALGIALFGTRFGNLLAKPMYLLGPGFMCGVMTLFGVSAVLLPYFLKKTSLKNQDKEEAKEYNEEPKIEVY